MKKARKKAAQAKRAKKKVAKKKAVTKKAGAKKLPAKKSAVKKAPVKKAPAKKAPAKKAGTAKTAAKTTKKVAKKAPASKPVAKKATPKTVQKSAQKTAKKVVTKVAKKAPRKAAPPKKVAPPATPVAELPLGARAAPLPTPAITPESPDAVLLALAQLLLDDAEYLDDVRLAVTAPEEYAATHADELKLRGVDGIPPNLPWLALTNGLRQRDALVPLADKFEPDDLAYALDTLLSNRSEKVDLAGLPGYDHSAAALQAVGDRLAAADLALVTIGNHEAAATFPVAILPAARVAEAQRLAATLGLGSIRRWSSEDLLYQRH